MFFKDGCMVGAMSQKIDDFPNEWHKNCYSFWLNLLWRYGLC